MDIPGSRVPGSAKMNRPRLFFALLLFGICTSSSQVEGRTAEAESLPNIVIILADDMGLGDVGAYNATSKVPTPSLDTLAASGMRFTDAHSPSAVCTPTRYGLLTGRYAWRTSLKKGVLKGYSPLLIDPARSTIASMLREKGYATAVIGKWHLGLGVDEVTDYSKPLSPGPNDVGFDHFFGIPASLDMPPYTFVEDDRVSRPSTATRSVTARDGVSVARDSGVRGPSPAALSTKRCCRGSRSARWPISGSRQIQVATNRSSSTCRCQRRTRPGYPPPSSSAGAVPDTTATSSPRSTTPSAGS